MIMIMMVMMIFVVCIAFVYALGCKCFNGEGVVEMSIISSIRPCNQRGSSYQDPAANRTTRRPADHCKETQTVVVWTCFPFIRSGQNHLARHNERGKKTMQTEEEVGRQHQGMDLSLIHISEPTRLWHISYAVFPSLPLSALSSSLFHCALQDGFGQT